MSAERAREFEFGAAWGGREVVRVASRGAVDSRAKTVTSSPCRRSSETTCQATFSTPPEPGVNRSITMAMRRGNSSGWTLRVSACCVHVEICR